MYKNKKYRSGFVGLTISQSKASGSGISKTVPANGSNLEADRPPRKLQKINENQENDELFGNAESQESIMPSQEPSQRRYFSQSNLGRSQSIKSFTKRLPNSYYENALTKCGVILENPDCVILEMDHIAFVNKLQLFLKSSTEYPENIQRFLSGFQESIKNEENLIKLLSGCLIQLKNTETTLQSQESLIKNFLMIDVLQSDLIDIFIDKMKVYAVKDPHEMNIPVIPLILSQLRFIDHLVNGEKLFNKLFNLLNIANSYNKNEIIRCFEDVIDTTRQDGAVQKLIELIPNDKELLTAVNIDTFGNMLLSIKLQKELRLRIVRYIKQDAPIALLPSFIKFILNFSHEEVDTLQSIVNDLRECLAWNYPDNNHTEISLSKIEIFSFLKKSLTRSKKLFDIWLKHIFNLKQNFQHRPIDLMILIIMISINDEKSNYIANVMKQKIKLELLDETILEKTVKEYSIVFGEYMKHFLEIIDNFLKDRDHILVKFGFSAYKFSFGIENCDQKLLLSKLLRFVCIRQTDVLCCGREHVDISTNALLLLTELNNTYAVEMQNYGMQLLKMLDRVSDFNLMQYRLIMDLLCSLAYPLLSNIGSADGLQDHLHMLVRKQVSSSILQTKKQGIIGAIRLIDHLAWTNGPLNNEEFDSELTFTSLSELPNGRGKEAAEIFDLILSSTTNCFESLSLCFDELSSVLSSKSKKSKGLELDKFFVTWLCDYVTTDLYNNFFIEEIPIEISNELSNLYCINRPEENENSETDVNSISINVGGLTFFKSNENAISSINILPALFNLVRAIHFLRYDGCLSAINAVPGCGILLPKIIENQSELYGLVDEKEDLEKTKKVMDVHFHLANWFRELINAFSSQDEEMIRKKILIRLNHLIRIESTIKKLLFLGPKEYTPPNSLLACNIIANSFTKFLKPTLPSSSATQSKTTKTTSKKKKQQPEKHIDTEGMSILATMRSQNETAISLLKSSKSNKNSLNNIYNFEYGPKEVYRHMSPDIMLLLKENVVLKIELPTETIGEVLGFLELKFILDDLVLKLESITGKRKQTVNDQILKVIVEPSDFVSDLIHFLPKIQDLMKQFMEYIKSVQDLNDTLKLFAIEVNYTKICFGLCLRLLSALFYWPDLKNKSNETLLKDALRIVGSLSLFETGPDLREMLLSTLKHIITYKDYILDLQSAVYLYDLTNSVVSHISFEKEEGQKIIVELCYGFLSKLWFTFEGSQEKGASCNIMLDKLLKGYFQNADLKMIKSTVKWVTSEIVRLKKKDDLLKTFPLISKLNFPLLFRYLSSSLVASMNEQLITDNVKTNTNLATWERACEILNSLLEIVKSLDIPRNFILFLKHSHIFLKLFLQYGMPMLEHSLRRVPERVNELLKNFQQTTRFLHNLCCHSKAIKNTSIVAQIPFLRQTIELLVFKVKATLAANNCSTVFWMGNLKNKDLHGDEILSQVSSLTTTDENNGEEDDEQLPPDDDDENDLELVIDTEKNNSLNDTEVSASSSRSRVF